MCSTPLAAGLAAIDDRQRTALERDVVAGWQPFTEDDALMLEVSVTYAVGHVEGARSREA